MISEYIKNGWSLSQAKSLSWAEEFENRAAQLEAKYQGNFSPNWTFDCYCYDCKKGHQFGAADSIRLFIWEHKGHKTKTMKIG